MVTFSKDKAAKKEVKVSEVKPAEIKKSNLEARVEAIEKFLKIQMGYGGTYKMGRKVEN